ncbi:hypothetical protein RR48_04816 [Papilio machaon]|uniref:Uncharacterized protein n=1 Tax=Papilio machaon TaxID=76193 RepID=A0A0N1IPH0_PAPMA|nr:hypothetical protein RR48_04816 [Papilio machaon]
MIPPFSWCFQNIANDGLDGYAVVSEYFGRGLFNKLTVVTEGGQEGVAPPPATPLAPLAPPTQQTYGPGAEAKLRLQEGQSKQVCPLPTHMQQLQPRRLSPTANKKFQESNVSPKISSAITNGANKNPFEDDTYDESKNPFSDDDKDPSNPFAEDDDYDKNLNPFS